MCSITEKAKPKKHYLPSITSLIAPVPHCEDLLFRISSEEDTNTNFDKSGTSKKPHFPNQQKMDDLIPYL